MKTPVFLIFSTFLFAGFLQTYTYFRYKFSGVDELKAKVVRMEEEHQKSEMFRQLALYQLSEYQEQVAVLMPEALKGKLDDTRAYPLRNLASVMSAHDAEALQIERASSLMESGKTLFREGKYSESSEIFSRLIRNYPGSVHVIEAHFLLAEGEFQAKDYEATIDTIEAMISLFPDSDLTGFALLRLGKIFESQDRLEDAAEVYKSVLVSFQEAALQSQAKTLLKSVQL